MLILKRDLTIAFRHRDDIVNPLLFFIIVGEYGLAELILLKREQGRLAEKSEQLTQENLSISIEIDRLKHDPDYIENVARKELGMIGEDEVILKPQSRSGKKK